MDELCRGYSADELATIAGFVEQLEPVMREETARVRAGQRNAAAPRTSNDQ
jgi:hypothetical protein